MKSKGDLLMNIVVGLVTFLGFSLSMWFVERTFGLVAAHIVATVAAIIIILMSFRIRHLLGRTKRTRRGRDRYAGSRKYD